MKSLDADRAADNEPLPEGWLPMSTAPRDGTLILVCELGNGEQATVLPAAYINNVGVLEDFWGVWPSSLLPGHLMSRQQEASEKGLPVGFRSIAVTPLCWKPLPLPEPMAKLRRRQGQILARKYKHLKK